MPRLAIPNLGNYSVALATAVQSLGVEPWATTATTPRALQLGLEVAPDNLCLPYKSHIGHFVEAAEAGVEYALMVNSIGTCRLRYYRALVEQTVADLGLNIRVFGLGYDGFKPPVVRYFDPGRWAFFKTVRLALAKMRVIDTIELETWRLRPRELTPGDTTRVMNESLRQLDACTTTRQTKAFAQTVNQRFADIGIAPDRIPLQVGLIGEVSVLRDKCLNQNIEETLGRLGVEVRNYFLLGAELSNIFHLGFGQKRDTRKTLAKIAWPYLKTPVGGHALDSVAHTIRCGQQGFDGMVHLAPTGCMPEVSVRPILRRVSRDYDIPVLEVAIDEHTSVVGFNTRLEAFADLMLERRRRRGGQKS